MKKQLSFEAILQMLNNCEVELPTEKMEMLKAEFENYTVPPTSRVEPKVPALRILVAKGVPIKTIAQKLGVQNYQVRTALNKRKTIEDDKTWTVDEIKESDYKNMLWSADEFSDIVNRGKTEDFDYTRLAEFRDLLVVPTETNSTRKVKKMVEAPVAEEKEPAEM